MADLKRIKAETVIVGYALSRLDKQLLREIGWTSFRDAYLAVEKEFDEKWKSVKGIRDEFDPYFDNGRRGWFQHPLRKPLVAVLHEFENVSDAALVETVRRIMSRDISPLKEVLESISDPPTRASGVAERLLTGRLAEEFFMKSCKAIVDVTPSKLVDMRLSGRGYDFSISTFPDVAIEVKGLKTSRGDILFTDREWSEARLRGADYWLVVVGCLPDAPRALLVPDPSSVLTATCSLVQSASAVWRAGVKV